MSKLLERLAKFFQSQPKSDLDVFISSKKPQSAADVEYWQKQWDHGRRNIGFQWGRGL
jgi:hypothetical protein